MYQEDYLGTISQNNDGVECTRWDDLATLFPNAGLEENYCRNLTNDVEGPFCLRIPTYAPTMDSGMPTSEAKHFSPRSTGEIEQYYCDIPTCDACSCMPPCGQPTLEVCACLSFFLAQECCKKDDRSCKCGYLSDACRISLENNTTDFCQ